MRHLAFFRDVTERRRLQRELIQVQEEERRSIGQELHDGIASQLTAARLRLSNLSDRLEEETVVGRIREIEESTVELRRPSHGLSPGGLSEGDLLAALKGLAESTEGARFESPLQENRREEDSSRNGPVGAKRRLASVLEEETATHLYRIAQEAVSNARIHGEAGEIVIRLKKEEGALVLEIEDDEMGFESGAVDKKASLGLRSMRRRAELIGAELAIESSRVEGTIVRCRLIL